MSDTIKITAHIYSEAKKKKVVDQIILLYKILPINDKRRISKMLKQKLSSGSQHGTGVLSGIKKEVV